MSNDQQVEQGPPRLAIRLVEWYCKPELAEDLLGDLNEYFERNVASKGVRRAKFIYVIDAFKFLRPYTVRKPKLITILINWIMIGSYIKTSGRNLVRNKLFSSINIIGLAISMSVGLLMISFIHDLLSYDRFHEKGDRTYRVLTWPGKEGESNQFASTSVRMGKLIEEKVPGIESITILRRDFGGDAVVGENTLPVSGLWADSSFLSVFTFPMIKGDPATALKQSYSVILTEQSAKKLFGDKEALGKSVTFFDTLQFQVTGVLKDVPAFSHLRFEALASFSTLEQLRKDDRRFLSWESVWSNYVYMVLAENADMIKIQSHIDQIAIEENAAHENSPRQFELQPLFDIALGKSLSNSIGPTMSVVVVWVVGGLSFVVVLSACFNYTNLSIARSIRRFKEVGLRKVIGAGKAQVRHQFLAEAVIVSLLALLISFFIFLVLREQFLNMAPEIQYIVKLEITPVMLVSFVAFSIAVGVVAGILPAFFFSKVSILSALKDASTVKVFRRVSLRRSLVVVQYTLTLIFITATFIGYKQYKAFLTFDLGFSTENILNINLQGNKADVLVKELGELPEVKEISKSLMVTSVGNYWGGHVKYKNMSDSSLIWYNVVDENYFPLHDHQLVAGQNFIARPATKDATTEVIVNEKALKELEVALDDPAKAVGEVIIVDGKKQTIVGVMKDFHYGKVDNPIEPVLFSYWVNETNGYLNLKIQSDDPIATMTKIEQIWRKTDRVHPLDAVFYKDSIEKAYSEFSAMVKVIGFLSFLAISIASMGLFGMVVFTTETRLKEISIRKVMGASSGNLVVLLSRGFIWMLGISAAIALPVTYFFFQQVVLTNFQFHSPIGMIELFEGLIGVLLIAIIMIGSQTLKAARSNPASVLKSE
jgi:ABC-type antimicrobial peptide transport system permease subunit